MLDQNTKAPTSHRRNKKRIAPLPNIPNKLYFTISEASDLCALEAHVLRYWEQEFPQLKPSKRNGGRRYYQAEDIIIIRRIRELLYDEGFTIDGARSYLRNKKNHVVTQDGDASNQDVVTVKDSRDKHLLGHLLAQMEEVLKELENND
jgi:DNA-binding transcriptional MerR regulator